MGVNHPQYGTFCAICFGQLRSEDCATDSDGQKWDVCKGKCAVEAGISPSGDEVGEVPVRLRQQPAPLRSNPPQQHDQIV